MRADMKQVLIERPRYGSWHGQRRLGKPSVRLWDGEDGFEDAEQPGRPLRTRSFSDLLGPLRKWLRRQVGRPWNTVWSEICAQVDATSVSGQHLREHVRWEVELHVRMDAHGVALRTTTSGWRPQRVDGLYVHPRHGLLCWQERDRSRWRRHEPAQDPALQHLGNGRFHQQIHGIWYELETGKLGPLKPDSTVPTLLWQGRTLKVLSKRQLGGAELRAAGRANTPQD